MKRVALNTKMEHLSIVCILFGVLFVGANSSDVLDFTASFDSEIGQHEVVLAEFFAPWCGHCKRLAPEYETAATKLKKTDPPVALAKVDCTSEDGGKDTCGKYGVSGYPTLKIFKNGEFSSEYDGPREADGIVSTMRSLAGPSAKEVKSKEEIEKISSDVGPTLVAGFFSKDDKEKTKAFMKAADSLFKHYKFIYSLSDELNKEFGYSDAVVIIRPTYLKNKFEEAKVEMTNPITTSNIEKFVKKNGQGLVGVMTGDNKDLFKKPLVAVYYDVDYTLNPKGSNYWRNRVMKVAKNYVDEGLTFAVAAAADFNRELDSVGMSVKDEPQVAIWAANGDKFKMEEKFTPDGKVLDSFVKKFQTGDLEPYLKSEAVPESNDGPVKVVVAKNFNDIVNDPDKDVLIEFYAPWCGHCKQLEPKYTELGEKMKKHDHVVIAKMDATNNDVPSPFEVSGFPTIYWAPAGNKSKPKKYQGGREVDDFVSFIKKESSKPIKSKEEL